MAQMAPLEFESLRSELEAVDRQFMDRFNAGDIAGAARGVYTENARVLPPGGDIVQGRENLVQFWQGAAAHLGLRRVELATVDVHPAGEMAYQIGRAALTLADGQQVHGKYLVVWQKENGQWRWHEDIWNMNA